jgi:hypothetical protein
MKLSWHGCERSVLLDRATKKEIVWMVHDAADVYFDVYRSATAQLEILNFALDQDPTLRDRLSDTDGKNQWDRNCAVLLGQNSYLREWHR